jgi:formate hydrogenlyase transcriptional activator
VSDGPLLELDPLSEGCEAAPSSERAPGAPAPSRLDDVQREHILRALESTGFRISGPCGAAVRLGMHPNTLRHRMHKLGIRTP